MGRSDCCQAMAPVGKLLLLLLLATATAVSSTRHPRGLRHGPAREFTSSELNQPTGQTDDVDARQQARKVLAPLSSGSTIGELGSSEPSPAPPLVGETKLLSTPLQRRLGRSPPELRVLRQRPPQPPFNLMRERRGACCEHLEVLPLQQRLLSQLQTQTFQQLWPFAFLPHV